MPWSRDRALVLVSVIAVALGGVARSCLLGHLDATTIELISATVALVLLGVRLPLVGALALGLAAPFAPRLVLHGGAALVLAGGALGHVLEGVSLRALPRGPALALLVFVLAPHPGVRLAAIAALALFGTDRPRRFELGADLVGAFALACLALNAVLPVVFAAKGDLARLLVHLAGLLIVAVLWSRAAARSLVVELEPAAERWPAVVAAVVTTALVLVPLSSPLAWRGDETHHTARLQVALEFWRFEPCFAALLAFAVVTFVLRGRVALAAAVGLAAGLAVGAWTLDPASRGLLARYFLPVTWLHGALSLAPVTLPFPWLRYEEGWYRLVPAASVVLGAVLVARYAPLPPWSRLLAAVALATLPSVEYFATLLYLEPPVILLMVVVVIALGQGTESVLGGAAYVALLALPFLKELAAAFALGVIAWVWLGVARRREGAREAFRLSFVLGVPVALGLLVHGDARPWWPQPRYLLDASLWALLPLAYVEQFGPLLLALPVGAFALVRRGRVDQLVLIAGLFLGYFVIVSVDGFRQWGLARFQLLFLPAFLPLAGEGLVLLARSRALAPVLAVAIGLNALLAPVSPVTGARRPFYGDHQLAWEEFTYPWDAALAAVSPGEPGSVVELVGVAYGYPCDLYARRLGASWVVRFRPDDPDAMSRELARVRAASGPRALLGRQLYPGLEADSGRVRTELERAVADDPWAVIVMLPPGDLASSWPERQGALVRRLDTALGDCRMVVYRR